MTQHPAHPANTSLQPGDRLDRYQIVEQIGAGGSSIVWKGDDDLLGQPVAIKQLLTELEGEDLEQFRQRGREEMELLRRLSDGHSRLVRVIDLIEDPRGVFIVMEYVDGPSLEQVLAQDGTPLDLVTAVKILRGIARGLETIHGHGVVHRDLKPANILLRRGRAPRSKKGGGEGAHRDIVGIKICDVGIAAFMDEQTAMPLGTVRYMAPELCRGEERVDGRADLYSLGMIAYEMIAGRAGFDEAFKSVVRDRSRQAMRWVKWHTNQRLSAPPLTTLNPKVPERLSDLVARLLEKDPGKRVGTAKDLVQAIDRHFTGKRSTPSPEAPSEVTPETTLGATPSAPSTSGATDPRLTAETGPVFRGHFRGDDEGDTRPVPKRKLGPVLLAASVGLVLTAAIGYWGYGAYQESQREAAQLAAVQSMLADARELYQAGSFAEAAERYRMAAESFDLAASHPLVTRGRAGALLAQAQIDLDAARYEPARAALLELDVMDVVDREVVYDLLEEVDRRSTFEHHVTQIEDRIANGRFGEARQLMREWQSVTLAPTEDETLRGLRVRLEDQVTRRQIDDAITDAQRRVAAGDIDAAIDRLAEARRRHRSPKLDALWQELIQKRDFDQTVAHAEALQMAGDWPGAVRVFNEALTIRHDDALDQRVKRLESQIAYQEAQKLFELKDEDGARQALIRAVGLAENPEAKARLSQIDTGRERDALIDAGDRALNAGEYDAAAGHYRAARELQADDRIEGKLMLAQANLLVEKGNRLLRDSRFEEARTAFTQARELSSAVPGASEGLSRLQTRLSYLKHLEAGDTLREQSRFADAKQAYRQARDVLETPEVQERLDNVEFDHLLAQARSYIAAREWAGAEAFLLMASQIRDDETVQQLLKEVKAHHDQEGPDAG